MNCGSLGSVHGVEPIYPPLAISGEANIEEGTKLLEKIKGNNFHTHILFKKDSHDFQGRAKKLSPLFCCSIHFFYFSQLNNMGNGSMVSIA